MKHLIYFALVFFTITTSIAQIQIGQDIDGEAMGDQSGRSVSISSDGTRVAIGALYNKANGTDTGHTRIYANVNGTWVQIGQDIDGEEAGDESGTSVSITANGKRVAIGASGNDGNGTYSGHTRIYEEISGMWVQIGQDIDGEAAGDQSGKSVSISADGTRVAIGAIGNTGNGYDSGHTRIYEESNGIWVQIGQDIDGEAAEDYSGTCVSISTDGTRIAIGAIGNDGNGPHSGHTRIFEEINGNWIQIGQDINGEAADDSFGHSVSFSADGTRIAIGAIGNNGNGIASGHTRIYRDVNNTWVQIGQDIDGEAAFDGSGHCVSISADGTRVAIGAIGNSNGNGLYSGHTRIYSEVNGIWGKIMEDIDGEAAFDYSGHGVSFSADGTRVAIGGPSNNGNGYLSGHTRIFKLNGTFSAIYLDQNQNCNKDTLENGRRGIPLMINPGNYIVETTLNGSWFADLPTGNYSITTDTTKLWKTNCILPQTFAVIHPDSFTVTPSIGLYPKHPCPSPDITIYMPFIRPCFTDQFIQVQACNTNQATGILYNATAVVTLDTLIIPTSFEIPYTNLGNNQYEFDLDSLVPGQCKDFWIKATVDCSAVLGQALCMEAELFPQPDCVFDSIPDPFPPTVQPCLGEWDESSLAVTGYCQNDSIFFIIENKGVGDMACYSPVTVYVDGVLHLTDSVQLNASQIAVYSFPGNGESWHLAVAQHPNHPGNSQPNATVENCGGPTGPTKINLFAQDDADPVLDIYCGEVTGSYDPNDKTGYPTGLTTDHHIAPNQQLQYLIRFQNTGTDTAFTVVIRDTLDTDLDIFSVRSGVASHAYSFRMYGQRVLEWTFNDIMLPDSNVNEPLSHGFVSFTVDQLPDLPDSTQITNSAGIYFDFNAPIITNIALHEVHYPNPITVAVEEVTLTNNFTLYPNPNDGQFIIDLKKEYRQVELILSDLTGRMITTQTYNSVSDIPVKIEGGAGIYLVKVRVKGFSEVFKVVKYD